MLSLCNFRKIPPFKYRTGLEADMWEALRANTQLVDSRKHLFMHNRLLFLFRIVCRAVGIAARYRPPFQLLFNHVFFPYGLGEGHKV